MDFKGRKPTWKSKMGLQICYGKIELVFRNIQQNRQRGKFAVQKKGKSESKLMYTLHLDRHKVLWSKVLWSKILWHQVCVQVTVHFSDYAPSRQSWQWIYHKSKKSLLASSSMCLRMLARKNVNMHTSHTWVTRINFFNAFCLINNVDFVLNQHCFMCQNWMKLFPKRCVKCMSLWKIWMSPW